MGKTTHIELDPEIAGVPQVSAAYAEAASPRALLVFAHGAGAGMHHRFMEAASEGLAERGVSTLRYNFPYMEQGRRAPDRAPRLVHTVRAAASRGRSLAGSTPVFAGGKSMGGRMSSTAQAEDPLEGVRGLVFFGFPLHPPKKPGTQRAKHLESVEIPMLFLQGTRDKLADLELLRPVCEELDCVLHIAEHADHGFDVLKRSGRTAAEVLNEILDATVEFIDEVLAR